MVERVIPEVLSGTTKRGSYSFFQALSKNERKSRRGKKARRQVDSAMFPSRFSRRPACGSGFADPNRPWFRARVSPPSHFSWGRVSVGRNWASEVPWKVGLESRLRTVTARLPRLGSDRGQSQRVPLVARVPSFRPVVDRGGLLAVLRDCCRSLGRCSRTTRLGRWRSYGSIRPVLKHDNSYNSNCCAPRVRMPAIFLHTLFRSSPLT